MHSVPAIGVLLCTSQIQSTGANGLASKLKRIEARSMIRICFDSMQVATFQIFSSWAKSQTPQDLVLPFILRRQQWTSPFTDDAGGFQSLGLSCLFQLKPSPAGRVHFSLSESGLGWQGGAKGRNASYILRSNHMKLPKPPLSCGSASSPQHVKAVNWSAKP